MSATGLRPPLVNRFVRLWNRLMLRRRLAQYDALMAQGGMDAIMRALKQRDARYKWVRMLIAKGKRQAAKV